MTEFDFKDGMPMKSPVRCVPVSLPVATSLAVSGRPKVAVLDEIQVQVSVSLGEVTLLARELLGLEPGALVTLDTSLDQEIGIVLNGKVVAQGTIVAIGERYGIRVSQTFYAP